VVGVDQSSDRIGRDKTLLARRIPDNLIWVRADLVDFWRLLAEQGIRLARHCLFYPNPWPKAHHLMRRWHAHPVFPVFAALGGVIECRTNWAVYAEEWSFALGRLAGHAPRVEIFVPKSPITPFERKYHASGHVLYRIEQTIPETGGSGR
jgi:tRNA (guanine-N7-)-methyltransferase